MSTRHLLDPELHPLVDGVPELRLNVDMLPKYRAARAKEVVLGDTERAQVSREEIIVPNEAGPDVRCLLYVPRKQSSRRPAYLHIHGGGYVMGSPEGSTTMNLIIASKLGAVILSVGYRLAPEHPMPAPLDDCYAALAWLHENANTWQVDRERIAVGGESAGGGLAAALAIQARDKGQYPICHQHLTYPMLDNLTGTAEQPGDPLVGEFVWTRASNLFGWKCLLGDAAPVAPQVPARVTDYSNLPPTWMFTAGLDLFRDENIDYAHNLLRAGVATELLLLPGACHGFQLLPGTQLGKRYLTAHLAALARGLSIDVGRK